MGFAPKGGATARKEWYDRNPASKADSFGATLVPHAETVRKTYTVPAGKKAMVESLQARVIRVTAATAAGTPYASWRITPSGGSVSSFLRALLITGQNAVKDEDKVSIGTTLTLFAGDKLEAATFDDSTAGTVYHYISYKLTEFDA